MGINLFWTAALNLIVESLPYRILFYYPVRDRLRVPAWLTAILIITSELLAAAAYGWNVASGNTNRLVEYLTLLVCIVIYCSCVPADVFRLLFYTCWAWTIS